MSDGMFGDDIAFFVGTGLFGVFFVIVFLIIVSAFIFVIVKEFLSGLKITLLLF